MIKSALQYLVGLGEAEVHYENGQAYSDKQLYLLENPTAQPFVVNTLSSLVDYLKSDFDKGYNETDPFIVHVISPTEITVSSPLNDDANRDCFIKAQALIPDFNYETWYDTETFNIKLQSVFVPNEDRDVMLKVVGNIREEMVKDVSDDGISQAVVARTGVASVGNVAVPNPVELMPYRTFLEVKQPKSDFVFRLKDGPRCALFEADGGLWKMIAIKNIYKYLNNELEAEVAAGKITIIA